MIFKNNKVYDVLKWIAQILLPALGTLYFALARIWGFPYAEEIVGTITAVDAFLGVLLGISSAQYEKLNGSNKIIKYNDDEIAEDAEDLINGI